MATYLALVNKALKESGITQDDLTTSNFASPPDPILTRFKQWVADAYEDIQTDRRDWEFMQNTGVTICNPKIEVYGCYKNLGTVADFAGVTFKLHNSANEDAFTSGSLTGTTDAAVAAGTAEGSLTISSFDSDVEGFLIEPGDLITNSTGTITGYFQRWGRYDLSQSASLGRNTSSDIAEIKLESVAIADLQFAEGQSYYTDTYSKLTYLSYADWLRYGFDRPKQVEKPRYFTLSNEGSLEFYPPLDTTYNVYFEYTRTPQTLSAYTDTPTYLPSRFHNAIVWRAIMYWAEYEGNGQQYNRAKSRYMKMEADMIRDCLPPVQVTYDARKW